MLTPEYLAEKEAKKLAKKTQSKLISQRKFNDAKKSKAKANKPKTNKKKARPNLNINKLLEAYKTRQLFSYEKKSLEKKLIDKADKLASIYIRTRDQNKGCVSYGANKCQNIPSNCCHWIARGRYSHRRDENNLAGGCFNCNNLEKQEHGIYFTQRQVNKFGQERVDEQLRKRNKIIPPIEKLLEIIEHYENKVR